MARDPIQNLPQDIRLLKLIWRANFDVMWAREPTTVLRTSNLCQSSLIIAKSLGFGDRLFPPMGPFPVHDTFGMGPAIEILQSSLQPGKYADTVQFGTVRRFRSAYSNVYQASILGQKAMTLAKDTRKMAVTSCPTYGEFFERFMKSMHKQMLDHILSCSERGRSGAHRLVWCSKVLGARKSKSQKSCSDSLTR
jgi:hypothetical protein